MKGDPVDLSVVRSERQARCMFCRSPTHAEWPLTCPRIEGVEIDPEDGSVHTIHFWAEYDNGEEDPDAAA